jgi:hypothetical protein
MSLRRTAAPLAFVILLFSSETSGPPLRTFRWQLLPFCNVITLNVVQQGAIYTLDGTDDRCVAGNEPASAAGVAYLTPSGLVGMGLSTVLPNGTPVHTQASTSPR